MSDSDNPYAAPLADLGGEIERFGGSIENTLAGNAELNVADVMSEAWQRTKGIKGIVWASNLADIFGKLFSEHQTLRISPLLVVELGTVIPLAEQG